MNKAGCFAILFFAILFTLIEIYPNLLWVIIGLVVIFIVFIIIERERVKNKKNKDYEAEKINQDNNDEKYHNGEEIEFQFVQTSLPKEYQHLTVKIDHWYRHSGEFVKKGDGLVNLSFINFPEGSSDLIAEYDGWLEVFKLFNDDDDDDDSSNILHENDKIFSLKKDLNQDKILELRKESLQNIPFIDTDDFVGTKEIKWESVCGKNYSYNSDIFDSIILWG